jgi:hypothetical protein
MDQNKKSLNKKLIAGVVALIAVIAILLGVYLNNRQPTTSGSKTITVSVFDTVGSTEASNTATITTDEEYLRGVLEQEDSGISISGSESEYGLFVTTVDGVTADDSKQQWWCFTKGGEMLNTGVDSTPIADGDTFEITLTEGY